MTRMSSRRHLLRAGPNFFATLPFLVRREKGTLRHGCCLTQMMTSVTSVEWVGGLAQLRFEPKHRRKATKNNHENLPILR